MIFEPGTETVYRHFINFMYLALSLTIGCAEIILANGNIVHNTDIQMGNIYIYKYGFKFEFSVALRPQRPKRTVRHGEVRTATSTFTQFLSSEPHSSSSKVALRPQRS